MAPRNKREPAVIVRNAYTKRYEPVSACSASYLHRTIDAAASMPQRKFKGACYHWCHDPNCRVDRPCQGISWIPGMPAYRAPWDKSRPGRRQPVLKPVIAAGSQAAFLRGAIEEGEDLAKTDVVLPWNAEGGLGRPLWRRQGMWRDWASESEWEADEADEEEADEEQAEGVVEGEGEGEAAAAPSPEELVAQTSRFGLECIPRSEETYTIRTKVRKRRSAPDLGDRWEVLSVASACSFVKV